jgi:DNA mismatch repair protein MutL
MGQVAVLPPELQGQIAAGEVVERPASVVKELLENALDAGARHVSVGLEAGGVQRIVVRDDGCGMSVEDAVVAFERHATSKLRTLDDLGAVATLGFRGEALPSIAAAGQVHLTTRRAEDRLTMVVEADAHGARPGVPVGGAVGTTVEVRELFADTPARRKFLRTPATEVGHVLDVVTRLAVTRPDVGMRLEHDGREVVAWPPVGGLRARLAQILGGPRAESFIETRAAAGGATLHAFLGPPRESLSSARLVWTFIGIGADGAARWVRDRLLLRAVLDGYASLLMRGRYPVAVAIVRLPPGEVDVNVHPAKLEVRFRQTGVVHQLVVPALRRRLAEGLGAGEAPSVSRPGYRLVPLPDEGVADAPSPAFRFDAPPAAAAPASGQTSLWQPAPDGFRALRFLGQIFDGYLLCEGDGRIVLIDQHAAHERVRFERLCAEHRSGGIARDALLVPEAVSLPATQVAALAEHADAVAAAGLEGEPFGDGTYLLRSVPRLLRGMDAGALLREVASELVDEGASGAGERAVADVLATVACHGAVRVGQRLDAAAVQSLLTQMDDVDVNAHCPHGRPVAVELSRGQVERLFGR